MTAVPTLAVGTMVRRSPAAVTIAIIIEAIGFATLSSKISSRHPLRVGPKSVVAVSPLLVTCLCAACGPATPPAPSTPQATTTPAPASAAVPARTVSVPPPTTDPPTTAPAPTSRCPQYPAATYGIDPNQVADTGGGAQLVTVVALSTSSWAATFTAWARGASGCWSPVSFAGQRDVGAGAVVAGSVAGGGTVAVLTGAAAEVADGVVVAGGVEGAGGVAGPHAAHRQVNSRQLPAVRDFAPILRGCRGLIFDERAASPRLLR